MKNRILALVAPLAMAGSAFAQEVSPVTQVTEKITSSFVDATALVTAGGLAMIGLTFLGFILTRGRGVAGGRTKV